MGQQLKVLAAKCEDLSSSPQDPCSEKQNQLHKLSSRVSMCVVYAHTNPHTCIYKYLEKVAMVFKKREVVDQHRVMWSSTCL